MFIGLIRIRFGVGFMFFDVNIFVFWFLCFLC